LQVREAVTVEASSSKWAGDVPVLGKLPPEQAAAKLREVGEEEAAEALERATQEQRPAETFGPFGLRWPFDRPWQYTSHVFGYLAPSPPGNEMVPIKEAGNIAADDTLKNSRLKITLNRLRVADYPGGGTHRVLFDFYAQNQVANDIEHLHFDTTFRVREGQQAAVVGYPIFVGLNVGSEGLAFKCLTVNVRNDEDESFLKFLESDVFQAGLKLASTAQPAIAPLSGMALALTKSVAARNRNVAVQEFHLGLDFSDTPMGARLAKGAYLAVQVPESFEAMWDWEEWAYDPTSGRVVSWENPAHVIEYNYLVFGVDTYEGP